MIKAILLDIEGTTTPIDFVHKTLFPFAKQRIRDFVEEYWIAVTDEVELLRRERSVDATYDQEFDASSADSVSSYLEFLIDNDRKSTPLKAIQGKIWQEGYESGQLRSVVFADVPRAFTRWSAAKMVIAIYSSGSVLAQDLIFRYSDHGDLTSHISSYFDTLIGHKREAKSYATIAARLKLAPPSICFVSDIAAELDAAAAVGFATALSRRPGNIRVDANSHRQIESFDELF